MRVIQKREYFNPNWEAMKQEPKLCKRVYVEGYVPNSNGELMLEEIGPFEGVPEAEAYIREWTKIPYDSGID